MKYLEGVDSSAPRFLHRGDYSPDMQQVKFWEDDRVDLHFLEFSKVFPGIFATICAMRVQGVRKITIVISQIYLGVFGEDFRRYRLVIKSNPYPNELVFETQDDPWQNRHYEGRFEEKLCECDLSTDTLTIQEKPDFFGENEWSTFLS